MSKHHVPFWNLKGVDPRKHVHGRTRFLYGKRYEIGDAVISYGNLVPLYGVVEDTID